MKIFIQHNFCGELGDAMVDMCEYMSTCLALKKQGFSIHLIFCIYRNKYMNEPFFQYIFASETISFFDSIQETYTPIDSLLYNGCTFYDSTPHRNYDAHKPGQHHWDLYLDKIPDNLVIHCYPYVDTLKLKRPIVVPRFNVHLLTKVKNFLVTKPKNFKFLHIRTYDGTDTDNKRYDEIIDKVRHILLKWGSPPVYLGTNNKYIYQQLSLFKNIFVFPFTHFSQIDNSMFAFENSSEHWLVDPNMLFCRFCEIIVEMLAISSATEIYVFNDYNWRSHYLFYPLCLFANTTWKLNDLKDMDEFTTKKQVFEFRFENPHTDWAIFHVFKRYYEWFKHAHPHIDCLYENSSTKYNYNPSGMYSPHLMTVTNLATKKYIIVSYWDKAVSMTCEGNEWNTALRADLITTSGTNPGLVFTPFSYLPYLTIFDKLSKNAKKMTDKTRNELEFRGLLYDERLALAKIGDIKIYNDKITPVGKYFESLTNNKICLSLNGAGQICNRDMEILAARSALFRPKLTLKFHNELKANYHYIAFEMNADPHILNKNILTRYNEVKNDDVFLKTIAENGYQWYQENGTVSANVTILQKILDIKRLF